MAMAIDGLVSNLQTTELINSLLQVEAAPQTLLKKTLTATNTRNSAFKTLNSLVATIATAAGKVATPDSLKSFTATSSSTSVTATAGSKAVPGSISFTTDRLATKQTVVTAATTAWTPGPITITRAGEAPVEIAVSAADFEGAAKAINAAVAGVTASVVKVGVDGGGVPLYRLQLSSAATGDAAAFQAYAGSAAEVVAGTAQDLVAVPGAAVISTARDAQITLWGGTAASQTVASSSNTFAALLTGVDVSVSAVSADPVTVTVQQDDKASLATLTTLTSALKAALDYIDQQSIVTTTAGADGTKSTTGGALTGDGTARRVREQLRGAAADPVDGKSVSSLGISFSRQGALEVDTEKFLAAMKKDPEGTQAAIAEIAGRLKSAATTISDKYDGFLTSRVTSGEKTVEDLSDQIEDWDGRLASRRVTLERTYSALEVQLANLQSQSSWLSSQLSSLGAS